MIAFTVSCKEQLCQLQLATSIQLWVESSKGSQLSPKTAAWTRQVGSGC